MKIILGYYNEKYKYGYNYKLTEGENRDTLAKWGKKI